MTTSRAASRSSSTRRPKAGAQSRTPSSDTPITKRSHRSTRSVATPEPVAPVPAEDFDEPIVDQEVVTDTRPAAKPTADLDEIAASADLVRVYLNEIGKVALLSAADEVELAKRIEAGLYARHLIAASNNFSAARKRELRALVMDGERAKDHLLRANLRLVVSLAKRYTGHGMPFLDLIQEGNLGLIRAVEKFDYAKGFKFSTYAMWWIRQSIGRGLPELARTIRLPVHVNEEVAKVARARRELLSTLNRSPEFDEIAELTGLSTERVAELSRLGRDPISLDATVGDQDDT
ncbi:MAG TPA: sigma-70 family RNA polymerase sigma factor, partial [Jatrophihabitantaceae bacterium]